MATKILFNGNRIIFDGHADTAAECQSITAMCDSLAANENFKTVVYEKGHAVFEQVSGGESEMFQALEQQIAALKQALESIKSCECDHEATEARLTALEALLPATAEVGQYLKVSAVDENGKITAMEAVTVAEYKLSLTASEVAGKLGQM